MIDSMGVWEEVDRIYLTRHGKPMSEDLQRKLAGLSILQAADYFRNVIGIDDPPEKCWRNGMNWLLRSTDMKFR